MTAVPICFLHDTACPAGQEGEGTSNPRSWHHHQVWLRQAASVKS